MPRIVLKPNSPEFAEDFSDKQDAAFAACDMPGCCLAGEHKAPKSRGLNEYYHFCLDHVRDYNAAWNFFDGLSEAEVQAHMEQSFYGDRPTWRYGVNGTAEEALYEKAWQTYRGASEPPPRRERDRPPPPPGSFAATPEYEALALMGLEAPVTLAEIKARYKDLAKKHHPDLNKGCAKSEEILKRVNMAYTLLKLAYAQFEDLPGR